MIRIGLIRHFPTAWNAEGRLQGRSDIPLSPEGRAALAGHALPEAWTDVPVLASPLSRAVETAETLAGRPVPADARLIEMDFGDWEGRIGAELLADPACAYRPVEEWGWDFRPPGGESPRQMAGRLLALLATLGGPHLLITHRGVMRCILALASGWDYAGPEPFRIRRASLHEVTLDAAGRPVAFAPPERLPKR
ncbi:MAG: histidine phosphatase family protein [Alphaproteobacteria bacterium]|nr:MAG: histidine phosphatase family protein [Alphaproteobacteria bacterium]